MNRLIYLALSLALISCGQKGTNAAAAAADTASAPASTAPTFDSDSAYSYVSRQVAFGPRVPNTDAHKSCSKYLASEMKRFGAKVYQQETTLTAYNGTQLQACNIIGSFNQESSKRILLFAHWDTRPFSDEDANPENFRKPIDGADDGASGVGVLLEIARQLGLKNPNIGIDIAFFDAEDYGVAKFDREKYKDTNETWCLGTQFWTKNPHVKNYKADYGILLDMVGAKNAVFYKEFTSMRYAARFVDDIWDTARDLGYGKCFIASDGGAIVDDHEFVIKGLNIPCLDIINYDPQSETGFASYWHTQNDNMQNIDRNVLKAVGQTLLETIYKQ